MGFQQMVPFRALFFPSQPFKLSLNDPVLCTHTLTIRDINNIFNCIILSSGRLQFFALFDSIIHPFNIENILFS
jgi:hypothetical protein